MRRKSQDEIDLNANSEVIDITDTTVEVESSPEAHENTSAGPDF